MHLPPSEGRFLRDFAYDHDTDGMRVMRAPLAELAGDPELPSRTGERVSPDRYGGPERRVTCLSVSTRRREVADVPGSYPEVGENKTPYACPRRLPAFLGLSCSVAGEFSSPLPIPVAPAAPGHAARLPRPPFHRPVLPAARRTSGFHLALHPASRTR